MSDTKTKTKLVEKNEIITKTLESKTAVEEPKPAPKKAISVKEKIKILETLKKAGMTPSDIRKRFTRESLLQIIAYMRDEDSQQVEGTFKSYESQKSIKFSYKGHAGDQPKRHEMVDGQTYTIPIGLANHINNDCSYPVHAYTKGDDGEPSIKVGRTVQRFGFQNTNFISISDLNQHKKLITIEKI
jgi:hypothetical protein